MEKRDGSKVVALVALVVAVVALSVGFAAYTAQLNITNASATLQATDAFSTYVHYDTTVTPKCYYTSDSNETELTGTGYSHGTASDHTWANVSVALSTDETAHKSVTCKATVINESAYTAALQSISSNGSYLGCQSVGSGSAAATNETTVCNNVSVTVNIGSANASMNKTTAANTTGITGVTIPPTTNNTQEVTMVIAYTGTAVPDGDISITIPTVTFEYQSAAAS